MLDLAASIRTSCGNAVRSIGSTAPILALILLPLLMDSGCGAQSSTDTSADATVDESLDPIPPDAAGVRDHPLNRAALGLWWGSGCPDFGACGCGGAKDLAQEFTCQMDRLQASDIPVGVYLFDGSAWSLKNSSATNTCSGADCCSWKLGDAVIQRLARDRVRGLVHFWGGCHEAEQYRRVQTRLGRNLLGFYLDDGSSDSVLEDISTFMKEAAPGNWETVIKAYQNREPSATNAGLSKFANVAYMGDLPYDFAGMREGITRILAKSVYLPAPYNEVTGYAYQNPGAPDEETYYRRLHFGAFQMVMAHTPYANADPWRPEYGPGLLGAYRYYAWVHKELGPYFLSYAIRMHEDPRRRVVRPGPAAYTMRVGNEIFVPLVTTPTRTLDVQLPGGNWIDYWNEQRVVSGSLTGEPAPLGREPVYLRMGSIIPMDVQRDYTGHGTRESAGSLTVLVYPSGTSSFRYYDESTAIFTTFTSILSGSSLTLSAVPLPTLPLLYRIGRTNRPQSVGIEGGTVTVNQSGDLPEAGSERDVNASPASVWFYDAAARRLIVKLVP
ncbi:MAG: hypothetical protein ABI565_04590 [Vicinamibacteria bacterium]